MNDWIDAERHVERAHEHYEAGRWEEAESELRAALSLNPYQAEWHFNLGLTLDAVGRFEDAGKAFEEAHHLSPEQPGAAMMVGVSMLRAGRAKESLQWLEQATKDDPSDVGPLVHRIEAHARLAEHEQAEVLFYMAQQIDAESAEAHAAMADSLLDRDDHERAIWCLREAARIDPRMPGVQARLAEVYARTGRQERARQLYLRELRLSPGDVDTILDLGELLVEMNRLTEAGEKFRRVLELEPDNADAHFDLGDLAQRSGRIDEAIVYFDLVLRLDAGSSLARRRLVSLLLTRSAENDLSRARGLLLRELGEFNRSTAAKDAQIEEGKELARLLLDSGQAAEASRVARRLVELRADDADAHHLLSVSMFESGNLAAGMESARRALRLEPKSVSSMYNLALACIREGRWRRARYWINTARQIDPDDASLRRLLFLLRLHSVVEGLQWLAARAIRPARRPA